MDNYDQKPKRKRHEGITNPTNYLIGGIVIGVILTVLGGAGFALLFATGSRDAIEVPVAVVPSTNLLPAPTWLPTVPPYNGEAQAIQIEPTIVANRVQSARVSPDGSRIVTVVQEGSSSVIYAAPFGPDGSLLNERKTLHRDNQAFTGALFSPGGDRLVVTSLNRQTLIFDMIQDTIITRLPPFRLAAYSHDGTLLALGGEGVVEILDSATLETLARTEFSQWISHMAFTAGNELLIGSERAVQMWLPSLEQVKATYELSGYVYGMALHPGGEWLALGTDGGVTVINLTNQERVEYPLDVTHVQVVTFSADGTWLAAAGSFSGVSTGKVFAWRWNQSTIIPPDPNYYEMTTFPDHAHIVMDMSFVNDGLLTASWDGTVRLWDFETGRQLSRLDL